MWNVMPELNGKHHSEASGIAAFLGLPKADEVDDLDLVDAVRKGFPTKTAATVARRIDPQERFLRATDIIPKSTYQRRIKSRTLTKDESEKLLALSKVLVRTLRLYANDVDLAAHFLLRNHPLLRGRKPLDLAKESTAGADLVLKLLIKAEAGVAV